MPEGIAPDSFEIGARHPDISRAISAHLAAHARNVTADRPGHRAPVSPTSRATSPDNKREQ